MTYTNSLSPLITPYPKIIVTPHYFPVQWCDNINNWMIKNVEPDTRLGAKGARRCTVRVLYPGLRPYNDVFRSMIDYVKPNISRLNVDLDYKIDGVIQHVTYNTGDYVAWHNDLLDIQSALVHPRCSDLKTNRKASMTVMLSNPSDYTGGKFIFDPNVKLPHNVEGKGTVALFTSHTQHRVEEITSGTRQILFVFLTGPEWR